MHGATTRLHSEDYEAVGLADMVEVEVEAGATTILHLLTILDHPRGRRKQHGDQARVLISRALREGIKNKVGAPGFGLERLQELQRDISLEEVPAHSPSPHKEDRQLADGLGVVEAEALQPDLHRREILAPPAPLARASRAHGTRAPGSEVRADVDDTIG